jgi:hypothetical protein
MDVFGLHMDVLFHYASFQLLKDMQMNVQICDSLFQLYYDLFNACFKLS